MEGISREAQMSMAALSMFPGFRFSPKDEELISFYLKNKLSGSDNSVDVISEIDICRFEPWDLPANSRIPSENEWFFFSPRGRKYPNGTQNKRATASGYWKATGKERTVKSSNSQIIGSKRTLVFHLGRAPSGERTEWIMHEYSLIDKSQDSMVICRLRKNMDFRRNNSDKVAGKIPVVTGESDQFSKNCSSSLGSHSLDQFDSAINESNQKQTSDSALLESFSHHKDYDDEQLFEDLLKDDIIRLDDTLYCETHNPTPAPTTAVVSEAETATSQGTATRRIKLKKQHSIKSNNKYVGVLIFVIIIFIIIFK